MPKSERANAAGYRSLRKPALPDGDNNAQYDCYEKCGNTGIAGRRTGGGSGPGRHDVGGQAPHSEAGPSHDSGRSAADGAAVRAAASSRVALLSAVPMPRADGRFVYVAQNETSGTLKVGHTGGSVASRLKALGCARDGLRLIAWWRVPTEKGRLPWDVLWSSRHAEIDLHARLGHWLVGGEWFRGDGAVLALSAEAEDRFKYETALARCIDLARAEIGREQAEARGWGHVLRRTQGGDMKITIESTEQLTTINGAPVRLWKGRTAGGVECLVFVSAIGVDRQEDSSEFDRELHATTPPAEALPRPVGT